MIIKFALLISLAACIQFNYVLPQYQIQCFHETAEQNSRYQISVKGNASNFYLHVQDGQLMYEDKRSEDSEYKQYSAFANNNNGLTFCIGNLADHAIYFKIEFYHGFYLEDSLEVAAKGNELLDIVGRMEQQLKLIQQNYDRYKSDIRARGSSVQRIALFSGIMVVIIIIFTVFFKILTFRKTVKYLKYKKLA